MSFSPDIDVDSLANIGDSELQDFLIVEQQKAQFQSQVHRLNDICWEKCIDKPSQKLDSRTETCMMNCVERFIDTSVTVTERFSQLLQKSKAAANAQLNQFS